MIPIDFDGNNNTDYYQDYGNVVGSSWCVVNRSYHSALSDDGVACFDAVNIYGLAGTFIGSRVMFRGKINIIEDPNEFMLLPLNF